MYLDEQPITTIQGALDIHIYDIARVEALAGPQGTLYGASSQAGTIRIITNKPELGRVRRRLRPRGQQRRRAASSATSPRAIVNMPLGDNAAVRLVGWSKHDAGYIDNVSGTRTYPDRRASPSTTRAVVEDDYNDVDTYGARAALRIDLNDNWTMTPTRHGRRTRRRTAASPTTRASAISQDSRTSVPSTRTTTGSRRR